MAEIGDLSQGDVLSRAVLARHHLPTPVFIDADPRTGALVAVEKPTAPSALVREGQQVRVFSEGLQCEAVILSQTCDIRQDGVDSITVAPVAPMSILDRGDQALCAKDRIISYLPLVSPPQTYVNLRWVSTITKSSLAAARVIARLTPRDIERLRLKLSMMLGRPALPDEVVAELSTMRNAIAGLKEAQRERVIGAYARWDSRGVELVIVLQPEAELSRLANALQRWLDEPSVAGLRHTGRILPSEQTSLADLDGYTRLALDYLSFPVRMEEA